MARITCPECRKKISETASACPKCGYRLTPEKVMEIKRKEQTALLVCSGIVGFVFIMIAFGVCSPPKTSYVSSSYEPVADETIADETIADETNTDETNTDETNTDETNTDETNTKPTPHRPSTWSEYDERTYGSRSSSSRSSRAKVKNSAWDGSVSQVKSYLKETLKDPRSLEFIEWSPVHETKSGYAVRAKYRAKNSFGGYVVANQVFFLDNAGEVLYVVDYTGR